MRLAVFQRQGSDGEIAEAHESRYQDRPSGVIGYLDDGDDGPECSPEKPGIEMGFGSASEYLAEIGDIREELKCRPQQGEKEMHSVGMSVFISQFLQKAYTGRMKTFVLFGSTGDLATRYVLPALGALFQK